jgi:hypothetical protein
MDIIPWEKSEHRGSYNSVSGRYGYGMGRPLRKRREFTFPRTVEYLDDSPRQYWRKGDIVRFDNGKKDSMGDTWQQWFMTEEDYLNTLPWNGLTPKYAEKQYAVVAGRYRVVKDKHGYIFKDYGVIVMMITGSKKGHIRKFWMTKPFKLIRSFPYQKIPKIKGIKELKDSFSKHNIDSNESRNAFLEHLHKNLNS